jgi:hypothetical protein
MRIRVWAGCGAVLGLVAFIVLAAPGAAGKADKPRADPKAKVTQPPDGGEIPCTDKGKAFFVVQGQADPGVTVDSVTLVNKKGDKLGAVAILVPTDTFLVRIKDVDCTAAGEDFCTLTTTFKGGPAPDTRKVKFKKPMKKAPLPGLKIEVIFIGSPTSGTVVPTTFYTTGTCDPSPVPASNLIGNPGQPVYNGVLTFFDGENYIFTYANIQPGTYTLRAFQGDSVATQSPIIVQGGP